MTGQVNAKKTRNAHLKKHEFKKGNPGGPGKAPMPQEVKVIRQVTRDDLIELALLALQGDIMAIEEVVRNARHADPARRPTPIQLLLASCLLKATTKGDIMALNSLLDRFFGRIPIAIQVQKPKEEGAEGSASGSTAKTIVFETVATTVEPAPRAITG